MLKTYLNELSVYITQLNKIPDENLTNEDINTCCNTIEQLSSKLTSWNKDREIISILLSIKNLFIRRYGEENVCFDRLEAFMKSSEKEREGLFSWDSSYYKVPVTIKFPEIKINNSKDDSHIIRDLYISINLIICKRLPNLTDTFNWVKLGNILGKRGVMSENEIMLDYIHSHISMWNGTYCEGQLSEIKGHYNNSPYNEDKLEAFLISFESGIQWESLEGIPHRKINNIINYRGNSSEYYPPHYFNLIQSKREANRLIFNLLKKYPGYPLPITITGEIDQTIEIDGSKIEDFHNYIRDLALKESKYDLVHFYSEGVYYKKNNTNNTNNDRIDSYLSGKTFSFKGQNISPKLYTENSKKQNKNNKDDKENYKIHPQYIEHFLRTFREYSQFYHKING